MSIIVIDAISKKLMCGDIGYGAMEEPKKIAEIVYNNIIKWIIKCKTNLTLRMLVLGKRWILVHKIEN